MIETPEIVMTEACPFAGLRMRVPREEIGSVMGAGVREVYGAVAAAGMQSSGPWFTHHFHRPDSHFDFEICVPVAGEFVPAESGGRVAGGVWPAMRVARTVFAGNYTGLAGAWGKLMGWIAAEGLTSADDLWERYLVGPEAGTDPAVWRTELNRPLVD
jgi:effector-binding domain-containing protein